MEDQKISQLIELVIVDSDRRDLYQQALPKMTEEEKLDFVVGLWKMLMEKLNFEVEQRSEEMIEEMADEKSNITYDQKDFKAVYDQILNELLAKRFQVEKESELERLRKDLAEMGNIVKDEEEKNS